MLTACDRLLTAAMRRQYGAMVDALNALPADDRRALLADAVVKAGALRPGPMGKHGAPSWPGEREVAIASAVVAYIRRPVDAWAEERLTSGFAHFWRGRSVKAARILEELADARSPSLGRVLGTIYECSARNAYDGRGPFATDWPGGGLRLLAWLDTDGV